MTLELEIIQCYSAGWFTALNTWARLIGRRWWWLVRGGSKLYSKSIPRCELSATWQLLPLNVLVAEESSDKLVPNYLSVWRQFYFFWSVFIPSGSENTTGEFIPRIRRLWIERVHVCLSPNTGSGVASYPPCVLRFNFTFIEEFISFRTHSPPLTLGSSVSNNSGMGIAIIIQRRFHTCPPRLPLPFYPFIKMSRGHDRITTATVTGSGYWTHDDDAWATEL